MTSQNRAADAFTRARRQIQRSRAVQSIPGGALPLAAATLVLAIVPIARAAGDAPAVSPTASPKATQAAVKPDVEARLARRRDVGGRGLRAEGRVKGTGHGKASVRLWIRKAGSRRWKIASSVRVRSGARFVLRWDGRRAGRYMTRVSVHKKGLRDFDATGRAWVFRKSHASYYGPGLYGGGLACGGRLSPRTIGVAHKTLPCGTRVSFTLGSGRVVTARVIDRGPFIAGRDWDLTAALKRKLRFGDIGAIWATH